MTEFLKPRGERLITFDESVFPFVVYAAESQADLPVPPDIWMMEHLARGEFPEENFIETGLTIVHQPSDLLDQVRFEVMVDYEPTAHPTPALSMFYLELTLSRPLDIIGQHPLLQSLMEERGFAKTFFGETAKKVRMHVENEVMSLDVPLGQKSKDSYARAHGFETWEALDTAMVLARTGLGPWPKGVDLRDLDDDVNWVQRRVAVLSSITGADEDEFNTLLLSLESGVQAITDYLDHLSGEPILPEPLILGITPDAYTTPFSY